MRRWVPPAVVVALLAWTALATPLSAGIGEYLAYYDPQSDAERLEHRRDVAAHVYTAGHWLGQLVAAVTGAWLVARSGAYRLDTVLRAALAGAVIGLATGTVAVAAGVGRVRISGYPDPTMLSDPRLRWCLLASLLCFPLWSVAGAALAGLVRRRALPAAAVAVAVQPATLFLWVGVVAPPSSHPLAVAATADAGPAALLMPAVLLGWAAAATAAAGAVSEPVRAAARRCATSRRRRGPGRRRRPPDRA